MSRIVEAAGPDIDRLVADVLDQHHPELAEASVKVKTLLVTNPAGGPALRWHGTAAAARIRRCNERDRFLVGADLIIELDAESWAGYSPATHAAVLDHELEHVVVLTDRAGKLKLHPDGRPKLGLRDHDWLLGGFNSIVDRHGPAALEAVALETVVKQGQGYFPWALRPVARTRLGESQISNLKSKKAPRLAAVEG